MTSPRVFGLPGGNQSRNISLSAPAPFGMLESFNARLRDELLDGEIFYLLREARIVIDSWRATTTRSGRMPHLDTSHQHRRCSCPHSPRGRLRCADRFRRPR
jgi:integrase-like protein